MKAHGIKKVKTVVISLLALLVGVCAFGFVSVQKTYANTEVETKLVLPSSSLEYYEPKSPIGVYSDQMVTAVMQNTDPNSLLIYINRAFSTIEAPSLTDVGKINDNTLIFSSEARIKKITLSSFDPTNPTASISGYPLNSEDNIATTYFELTENYLITAYEKNLRIFQADSLTQLGNTIFIDDNSRIAASINDTFYCVRNGQIIKYQISNASITPPTFITNASPTEIVANENHVFYVENDKIFMIDVATNEVKELSFVSDPDHQLGNTTINASTRISFRNDNLLITDATLNAVQEFSIKGQNLVFTGFAIAKDKTAYNRISKTVYEIERQGDTLAVLDGDKLSVIKVGENFSTYDKTNFKHYFVSDLTGSISNLMPDTFALGNGTALLLYGQGSNQSSLSVINFNLTTDYISTVEVQKSIRDVCYQSGKYYIFCNEGNLKSVYQADEKTLEFSAILQNIETDATQIEVDVFGKVYLYKNDKIYSVNKTINEQISISELPSLVGVKKVNSDLGGTLFALTDNAVYCLDQHNVWQKKEITSNGVSTNIVSMDMDYDKKVVYFVYENQEQIFSTESLSNIAIDDISIPNTFITTSSSTDLQAFKAFTAKENANVYSVETNTYKNKFQFNSLVEESTDYAFITQITITEGLGENLVLYALAGQNGLVLINKNEVVNVTPTIQTVVPNSAFVTTSVNGYYLPLITVDSEYSLTDVQTIRLEKEQNITPLAKITFLEKEYYFAEFLVNGVAYKGYVPVSFTVEVLSQDFKWSEYSLEKVKNTTVYLDAGLKTKLTELKEDTLVRIISEKDGVVKIAFKTSNGYVLGYVNSNSIKNDAKIAIRNILLILAIVASVCGTTTFFLLRKKTYPSK